MKIFRAGIETKVTKRDEIETASHETRPKILPETLSKKRKKWLKFKYFAKKIKAQKSLLNRKWEIARISLKNVRFF